MKLTKTKKLDCIFQGDKEKNRKPVAKFGECSEKPHLNGRRRKNRWDNRHGAFHSHGDGMQAPK